MVLDTRRNIGNAGLAMAIAYFGSNGYTVSVPLNDTQDYDLVVDMGGSVLFMWRWDNVPYPERGNQKSEYALSEYIEKQICF